MSSMQFDESEIQEFKTEALELLEQAESQFLLLDKGQDFTSSYSNAFRVFHSLKGAAGMMTMTDLQSHMHHLENSLTQCKENKALTAPQISYFLQGIDVARSLLDGKKASFDHGMFKLDGAAAVPATEPHPAAAAPEPRKETGITHISPKGIVYVVDDEPEVCEILKDILVSAGFNTTTFTDPQTLCEAVQKHKPDVICSDINMPTMSGLDVIKKIKAIDHDLPVIFISAFLSRGALMESIESGVYAVIEKPFKDTQVIRECLNAVRRYHAVRLLNRSIHLIMYQYPDLDEYLRKQGKDDICNALKTELDSIITSTQTLRKCA